MNTIDVYRILNAKLGVHFQGANLEPQHAENPKFIFVRVAPNKFDYAVEALEAEGAVVEYPLSCDTRGITIRVRRTLH